jgi:poly(3-hydroxybutyrate) depolymerase
MNVIIVALAAFAMTTKMPGVQGQCTIPRETFPPTSAEVYSCNGIRYHVVAPPECVVSSCGLIFDAHGFTMTADGQNLGTNMRELGYNRGYIVVNPEKPSRIWAPDTDHDDVMSFYASVISSYAVNRSKTHFTGFSMGGLMTWDVSCRYADLICSAAPLAASGYDWWALLDEDCWSNGARNDIGLPSPRVPDIFYVAGTKDKLATFGNAQQRRDDVLEVYNTTERAGVVVSSDDEHLRTRWLVDIDRPDLVFEFIQHDYFAYRSTGHCFPQIDPVESFFTCKESNAAWNVGELVIDFFVNNPCE